MQERAFKQLAINQMLCSSKSLVLCSRTFSSGKFFTSKKLSSLVHLVAVIDLSNKIHQTTSTSIYRGMCVLRKVFVTD